MGRGGQESVGVCLVMVMGTCISTLVYFCAWCGQKVTCSVCVPTLKAGSRVEGVYTKVPVVLGVCAFSWECVRREG